MTDFVFEPLAPHHDRAAFDCGQDRQTDYFRKTAGQHHAKQIASVHVLFDRARHRVAGYYTLGMLSIDAGIVPDAVVKGLKLPKQGPLPAVLIGRLARDSHYRGQGIGELLVVDALVKAFSASADIGCVAVIVDPDGEEAVRFWLDFGFLKLGDTAGARLFLPMASVETLVADKKLG